MTSRKTPGQSVVILALVLPFLLAFVLLVIEVSERWLEVAMVEDAMQQATRSAVQSLDYAVMATGADGLRGITRPCTGVTLSQAGDCAPLIQVADRILRTNLMGVRGLGESRDALSARVQWTVLPNGGTCAYRDGSARTETTPMICAEVSPVMTGIVGWGSYTPLITAADTLDQTHP